MEWSFNTEKVSTRLTLTYHRLPSERVTWSRRDSERLPSSISSPLCFHLSRPALRFFLPLLILITRYLRSKSWGIKSLFPLKGAATKRSKQASFSACGRESKKSNTCKSQRVKHKCEVNWKSDRDQHDFYVTEEEKWASLFHISLFRVFCHLQSGCKKKGYIAAACTSF